VAASSEPLVTSTPSFTKSTVTSGFDASMVTVSSDPAMSTSILSSNNATRATSSRTVTARSCWATDTVALTPPVSTESPVMETGVVTFARVVTLTTTRRFATKTLARPRILSVTFLDLVRITYSGI
jgi:hypothetical protein